MVEVVDEVRRRLAAAGDAQKAPRMQAYMKSSMPFRGVSAVPLKAVCRAVFDAHRLPDRDSWRSAVLELWDGAQFREERYAAVALTGHRYYAALQDVASLALYRHLVLTGAWWDHVDAVASRRVGPVLRAHPGAVTAMMRAWAVDDDLWVRRTALLCQLGGKAATDVDLLGYAIEQNLTRSRFGDEFFIRKAIGWALREQAKTDQRWVVGFVADHGDQLSGLSRREALKNVRDAAGGPTRRGAGSRRGPAR
ncbi:MAG TPA: DNA alkylation repair protein [Nocardioidaceae bacterium]|nr:DNA alkylation repair protein [Nocardioidaceae bacterium]